MEEETKEPAVSENVSGQEPAAPQFIGLSKQNAAGESVHSSDIRELLEKNLKWSQIIYEQNRRISRRLLWAAIAAWFKWALIAAVIAWSVWWGWPIVNNLIGQYNSIANQLQLPSGQKIDATTLEKLIKMLPIDPQQQEQIKAMTK
jgi:hypothetical protein